MADAQSKIKLDYGFADDTSRGVEIGPFASDAAVVNAATLKSRVKAFDPTTIQGLYLSDGGASCTRINSASITTVKETEINLNVD